MGKIAFLFPGQGAQYIGMGQDFYEKYDSVKATFEQASKAASLDVASLCFSEEDKINQTEYTQIAMLTVEVALAKVLMEAGITPDVSAGLSLGEYAAIAVSGCMAEEDLFSLIRKRGIYMQEAYPEGGAMTAVLGMDGEAVHEICTQVEGVVDVANYNCPGQIVISGEQAAVDKASECLKEAGAKRCIPLKVSGPFHSPLLSGAGEKLAEALKDVSLKDIAIPYYCNVEAKKVTDVSLVKDLLSRQVSSSVMFEQSVREMVLEGVDTFVEIGPGKTVAGFLRKIDKQLKVVNLEKVDDLDMVLSALSE